MDATYHRIGLKHIGANIVSGDADPWTVAEKRLTSADRFAARKLAVIEQLKKRVHAAIDNQVPHMIVLFHDVHPVTSRFLNDLIELGIKKAFTEAGATAKFVQNSAEALQILSSTHV